MAKRIKRFHATRRRVNHNSVDSGEIEDESLTVTVMIPTKYIWARENRKGLVEKYAQMMRNGTIFDPIELILSHQSDKIFECADGNHRVLAARKAGVKSLLAVMLERHHNEYLRIRQRSQASSEDALRQTCSENGSGDSTAS